MHTHKDYYDLLGIPADADAEAVEAAYRQQAERYNPDRFDDGDAELRRLAESRTAELQQAYQVLSDPEQRQRYDARTGRRQAPVVAAATKPAPRRQAGLTPREWLMTLAVAVLAIALLAGIWMFTGRDSPEAVAMGETMRPAPPIELARLGGGQVDLADYRGQVVLVNFWGTWCEPCRRELPALQRAYEQLEAQGFTIIGVNLARDEGSYGNDEADIQAFLDAYGVTYPIALDYDGKTTNDYRVFPLPTSFFIDPDGNIRYVRVGEVSFEDVVSRFEQLRGNSTAQQ